MKQLETELNDRIIRFDGVSIIEPDMVYDMLLRGVPPSKLLIKNFNKDIEEFNARVGETDSVKLAHESPITITAEWQLPQKYKSLNIDEFIALKFETFLHTANYSEKEQDLAINRIVDELQQVKQRGMIEFFQTIIYAIDTFKDTEVVWGIGRGSSCASYILFLINVHMIDCIKYNINMDEFFHD